MAGLISNVLPGTTFKPFAPAGNVTQAESTGYDPTMGTVNLPTDTVSGQLDAILSKDNPYITRARASSIQEANAHGLVNSLGAVQAGEAAAIGAAFPIAAQDANTFSTQRLVNQAAGNTANQFGAASANQAALANTGEANRFGLQEMAGGQQLALQSAEAATRERLLGQQGAQETQMQTLKGAQITALTDQQAQIEQALLAATGEQKLALQEQQGRINNELQVLKGSQDLTMQGLRGTQAIELANIEGTYRTLLQTSASATSLYTSLVSQMSAILQNNDLTPENKQAALDALINGWLDGGLSVVGGMAHVDLTSLVGGNSVQPAAIAEFMNSERTPQQKINYAISQGLSPSQVEAAAGWDPGAILSYKQEHPELNWGNLV